MSGKKTPWAIVVSLLIILGLAYLAIAAEWPAGVPEVITINDPVYEGQHLKGPVKFPHQEHVVARNLECNQCHHVFQDGRNVWQPTDPVQPCSSCHKFEETDGKMFKMKMGTVFHNLCRNCHNKNGKGPRKCDECHQPKAS